VPNGLAETLKLWPDPNIPIPIPTCPRRSTLPQLTPLYTSLYIKPPEHLFPNLASRVSNFYNGPSTDFPLHEITN
jgi:hypothetical protein